MKTVTKTLLLAFVLTTTLFAGNFGGRRSIGDIEADPARFFGKTVTITGRVTNGYGAALVGGTYKVEDGTGSIWVVTDRGIPQRGAQVKVKGVVQNGVTWSGRNYGLGILEKSRKFARN